jgi:apyrase
MDAGSSGTKMNTLYWDAASPLDAPIEVGKSQKVKPGIASFKDDLSKVSGLLPLLEQARLNLDGAGVNWKDVPLFLGATAGMRLLPTSDRMAIMASIRSFFRENGFRVDDDDWVRVLSGMEEGAFGWLTVNMSLKTLDGSTNKNPVGLIDIGGASVELTYLSKLNLLENKFHLDIVDYEWNLYSHSFLYFGNDQANKQYRQKLSSSGETADPCYPIGGNNTDGMPGSSYPAKCKEAVKSILPLDVPCFQFDGTECSMLNQYLPTLVKVRRYFSTPFFVSPIYHTHSDSCHFYLFRKMSHFMGLA